MRLLLFLEHRFYNIGNEVYCERIINYKYLTRYLKVFDDITVCARFGKGNPTNRLLVSGKHVNFLPLPDFIGSIGIVKKYLECIKIIKENINKYDVVIIRTPSPISAMVYPVIKKSAIPYAAEIVINPQTMFGKDSYPSILQPIISGFFTHHTKSICMHANGVSYVTERVLQKLYPCRALVGNERGYFTEYYSTIDLSIDQCCEKVHIHEQGTPYIIVHTGYMDTYSKGHLMVMNIASRLLEEGILVEVHFIGSGFLENEFKNYAEFKGLKGKVFFCGNLKGYTEVQKELQKADLFLFPTCSEGLPRALIEAMANSVACVSSPVDGIIELLPQKYLAHYRDEDGLFKICKEILRNERMRLKVAHGCYKKSQEYTVDKLEERRVRFYSRLRNLAIEAREKE